jgi:hypothetical protein
MYSAWTARSLRAFWVRALVRVTSPRRREGALRVRPLLRVVEAADDDRALRALADVLRALLDLVREERQARGALDGLDCTTFRDRTKNKYTRTSLAKITWRRGEGGKGR